MMGLTLSEPTTAKESASVEDDFYKVGSSCMQGWRSSMEDAHVHILRLNEDPDSAFFAVFDGHGGVKTANHCSKHLHKYILRRGSYAQGNYLEALKDGFTELDTAMKKETSITNEMSGCTAVTVLIRNHEDIYCSNIGDSRCVVSIDGAALNLSNDHKPDNPEEQARIEAAGGQVMYSRVNGNLALSRAFGDYSFKDDEMPFEKQMVTCVPEIIQKKMNESWDFMIVACDGIWDMFENQEAVDFVSKRVARGMEPEDICEEVMMRALASPTTAAKGGFGCDNMTIIIVLFLHDKPHSRLVEKYVKISEELEKKMQEEGPSSSDDDSKGE